MIMLLKFMNYYDSYSRIPSSYRVIRVQGGASSKFGGSQQIGTFKELPPNFEKVLNIQISILLYFSTGFLMFFLRKILKIMSIDYRYTFC